MLKLKRGLGVIFFLLLVSFSLMACTHSEEQVNESNYQIKDFLGREVTIANEPQRIVSLSPSTTELIYALGIGDRVVGVTDYDDYPPEVKELAKVGDFSGPNVEAIVAQKPDLILASSVSGTEEMEALQKQGIPVLMLEAKNINQIYQSLEILGELTGTEQKAAEIIAEMKNKINEIHNKVKDLPKVDVFYLVDVNGNWTAGKGTFIDELLKLAQGNNLAGDVDGWVQYSIERLVEQNPEVIIAPPHAGDLHNLKNMPGYKETKAVKNDRVFIISDDNIISRGSNRIVIGLEEIAKFLHPEAFK